MTDTTRDLIQRLTEELDTWMMAHHHGGVPPEIQHAATLVAEARALLSQPEPEGLTDEEDVSYIRHAAQAVIEAWWNAADGEYINGVWTPNRSAQLAAALEDLVDRVAPGPWRVNSCCDQREHSVRGGILAIAAELRGTTTPTETP
jgi:hypothetical protein